MTLLYAAKYVLMFKIGQMKISENSSVVMGEKRKEGEEKKSEQVEREGEKRKWREKLMCSLYGVGVESAISCLGCGTRAGFQ